MADRPQVKEGQWIRVGDLNSGNAVNGLVMGAFGDYLAVGYYQNQSKAVKEDVVWNGTCWEFKYSGPNASYLHGAEEAAVKRGPSQMP